MFKKLFCNHKYHSLTSYEEDVDEGVGYKLKKFHIIYCPKCKKQKKVTDVECQAIMEKQRIEEEYESIRLK